MDAARGKRKCLYGGKRSSYFSRKYRRLPSQMDSCTAAFRWPPRPAASGARGGRCRLLEGSSGWGGGRMRATLMSSCMKHESSRRRPCSSTFLNTIDALILNCSTLYSIWVCGCVCARAPSPAKLVSTNSFPPQHQTCATNQDQLFSQHWLVTGGSLTSCCLSLVCSF